MKFIAVAGVGRSGTTFLARLMALSPSPMKVVMEPFPRAAEHPQNGQVEPWSVLPGSKDVAWAREVIASLAHSNDAIQEDLRDWTVEREDEGFEFVLVKLTHSLLALPEILEGLDYKAVVIQRDTARVIDSFFHGHTWERRHYLIDEYCHLGLPPTRIERMQQAVVTAAVKARLAAWVVADGRVYWTSFESLCAQPRTMCQRLYNLLDLKWGGAETANKIQRMTTGSQEGYYDTRKNSRQILDQPFKHLSETEVETIRGLL